MVAFHLLTLTTLSAPLLALVPRQWTNCSSNPVCPGEDGCMATISNGAVFQMKCATDLNGPTIDISHDGPFLDCSIACSTIPKCAGFNHNGDFCYLISQSDGKGHPASNVVGGLLIQNATSTPSIGTTSCGSTIDCSNATTDGCFFTSNNQTFITRCNMDFYGDDFGITQTRNLTTCVQRCASTNGCQAVSFLGGTCYLKNAEPQGLYSEIVMGAYLQL